MRFDHRSDDREAEPGTPTLTGSRIVEPHETVEDPVAIGRCDAWSVVVNGEYRMRARVAHGQRDHLLGVAGGVAGQIAHHPLELGGTAEHPARTHPGGVDRERRGPPQARGLLEHEVVEIDLYPAVVHALVEPGEEQQIVDQLLHPEVLAMHDSREIVDVGVLRTGERDLRVLSDRSHRRAQLMCGV